MNDRNGEFEPRHQSMSRRRMLQSSIATTLGCTLAGCDAGWRRRLHGSAGRELKVFNWSDYIEEQVIERFENEHDCRVVYDNYASDSELETRLAMGAGGYDVVFPSDRAMSALLKKDLLQPIDVGQIENFRHLDIKFLSPPFDRQNEYSLPYFWGTLAVGVRSDFVSGDVKGLEVLFDPRNKGRITMLDDMENVVAAALSHLGLPLNSVDAMHLAAAEKLLVEQRPLVQAYTSDSNRERLIAGQAWAVLGWSGDLLQAAEAVEEAEEGSGFRVQGSENRGQGTGDRGRRAAVRVVVPERGTMLWMDSMVIPRRAENVELAHAFVNFLLEPSVGVMNAVKVNYATPNRAAREMLPAEMLADESIYLPQKVLERCAWLEDRGEEIEKIERVWRVVRG